LKTNNTSTPWTWENCFTGNCL